MSSYVEGCLPMTTPSQDPGLAVGTDSVQLQHSLWRKVERWWGWALRPSQPRRSAEAVADASCVGRRDPLPA